VGEFADYVSRSGPTLFSCDEQRALLPVDAVGRAEMIATAVRSPVRETGGK
jgi:hypothetical protein